MPSFQTEYGPDKAMWHVNCGPDMGQKNFAIWVDYGEFDKHKKMLWMNKIFFYIYEKSYQSMGTYLK